MKRALSNLVKQRAGKTCEYCQLPARLILTPIPATASSLRVPMRGEDAAAMKNEKPNPKNSRIVWQASTPKHCPDN